MAPRRQRSAAAAHGVHRSVRPGDYVDPAGARGGAGAGECGGAGRTRGARTRSRGGATTGGHGARCGGEDPDGQQGSVQTMIGGTRAGDRQESFMSLPHLRWSISALWISLALLMFTLAGNFSVRSWLYVIATTLV